MATFEGYERREAKILSVLKEYGITYEDIKKNGGKVVTNGIFLPLLLSQIEPNQSHLIKQMPEARINTGFRHFNPLFKLPAEKLIIPVKA